MDETTKEKPTEEVSELQFIVTALAAASFASVFYLGSKAELKGLDTLAIILLTVAIPLLSATLLMIKSGSVARSSLRQPHLTGLIGAWFSTLGIGCLVCGISIFAAGSFGASLAIAFFVWCSFENKLKKEQAEKEPEPALNKNSEGQSIRYPDNVKPEQL